MFQAENDPKGSRAKPDSFTDCEVRTRTQIIPALHENKVNVDNDVTDCEFAEININKPPHGELIQIKVVETVLPNNIKHVKTTFDEVVSPFTVALQSKIRIQSEDIPNIIPTDKTTKTIPIDVDDNYLDSSQDINKDQREKSNVKLVVASTADDECSVVGKVTNEQDVTPKQIIPALLEKKVNVNDDVTDYEFAKINTNKPPQGELIQDEMAKRVIILDNYKKDNRPFEDMPADNVASEDLPIQIKEVETVLPNNIKHVKTTFDEVVSPFTVALQSPIRIQSEDILNIIPTDKTNKIIPIDVDDNYFDSSQDINKDQREKSNVRLVVASNADDECSVVDKVTNEQDITPKQIIPALLENKVNVDDDVTDCEFAKINTNKPPQRELIQDEMAKRVIIIDSYKKDNRPFEDIPADNVASDDLKIQIKKVETFVPNNNIKHVKNTFDEVVSQFTKALQYPMKVKSEDNTTQDINKDQREKSNVSLVLVVASNEDDEVVLCAGEGNVKNEQDENENKYCGIVLPSQENMEVLSGNDATLTNVTDWSDEESTPKRFTFTDSDLPSDGEIRDILMAYPKPIVDESFSESESESSSEDESYEFLRRCRNKAEPVAEIDLTRMVGIEKLPSRVMTRLRKVLMFKPRYVTEQEPQMDEDTILENINRIKSFKKAKTRIDSKNHESIKKEKKETTRKKTGNKSNGHKRKVKVKLEKPERKGNKSKTKSFARNNTKKDSLKLNSKSAVKTTTRRTRSMKKENDCKNTQKPDHKRKPCKKKRSIFPEIEERRSKRQQKAKENNDETIKAPSAMPKKSKPKQSTVNNVSSSSSELPKSLKRSLVDDSDVPSPKRTRSHNNIINNGINYTSLRATPARVVKTQYVHLSALPGKENKQDILNPYVYLVRYEPAQKPIRTLNSNRNFLTRSQLARRRVH